MKKNITHICISESGHVAKSDDGVGGGAIDVSVIKQHLFLLFFLFVLSSSVTNSSSN